MRRPLSSGQHYGCQAGLSGGAFWGIENKLHWCLDVAFDEDHCRVRKAHGAENFAVLRHIALNLIKQETTCRQGLKGKRLKAGWDEDYLAKILSGFSDLNL